jgi:hypothetical protein
VIGKAVQLVKAAGKFIAGLFGGKDKKEDDRKEDDPEKAAKEQAGVAAIHQEEQKYIRDGGIAREDAEKVAVSVKHKHPVFKSIQVVEGKETWNYDYIASPGKKEIGANKAQADVILKIEKVMDRPAFRPTTKEEVPITKGEDRRHIEAWQVLHERLKISLNGKTVKQAAKVLERLGHPPSDLMEEAVLEAARAYLRDQFNNEENLWAGPAKENQEKGRQFAAAKRLADAAFKAGNKKEFEANIAVLEALWRDPDPSGSKEGFVNVSVMTVRLMRKQFRERWG